MEAFNSKLTTGGKATVNSIADVIGLATKSVELSASLQTSEYKWSVASLELNKFPEDLERAQTSIVSLETSLEANKAELSRLCEARGENFEPAASLESLFRLPSHVS